MSWEEEIKKRARPLSMVFQKNLLNRPAYEPEIIRYYQAFYETTVAFVSGTDPNLFRAFSKLTPSKQQQWQNVMCLFIDDDLSYAISNAYNMFDLTFRAKLLLFVGIYQPIYSRINVCQSIRDVEKLLLPLLALDIKKIPMRVYGSPCKPKDAIEWMIVNEMYRSLPPTKWSDEDSESDVVADFPNRKMRMHNAKLRIVQQVFRSAMKYSKDTEKGPVL